MKEVEFHFNVGDKLAYSCRLLRKIVAAELRAVVIAPSPALQALDAALWSVGASEFIAHCHVQAPPPTLAASPIWLAEAWPEGAAHEVMLNLGATVPAHFDRCQRYLEVVSTDPQDVEAGRQRWRHYKALGMPIKRFDRQGQS